MILLRFRIIFVVDLSSTWSFLSLRRDVDLTWTCFWHGIGLVLRHVFCSLYRHENVQDGLLATLAFNVASSKHNMNIHYVVYEFTTAEQIVSIKYFCFAVSRDQN